MKKEIIICCIVILIVVILNIVTESYTKASMEETTALLNSIREKILNDNNQDLKEDINLALSNWTEMKEKLSYYVEHEELEKVELYLWEISSYIEIDENSMAVQAIDSCNFLLSHIEDKYKLTLANIF